MTATLDKRLHAYRDDLADVSLQGRVKAARFVEGRQHHVTATIAPVHPRPSCEADLDTQALYGEAVRVFDIADGWAWCQLQGDDYVGYMPADMLTAGEPPVATHKVMCGATFAYTEPNARSKPLRTLLFGAQLRVIAETDDFLELAAGGFVGQQHAEPLDAIEPDYLASAATFLGCPYLWGGKSINGIDCSGLVQLSLKRAGIACPRDTDMQARQLPGNLAITPTIIDELRRGDLVYWPGHVGLMLDTARLLHANGTNMSTTIDAVRDVAARSRAVAAVKRLYLVEAGTRT